MRRVRLTFAAAVLGLAPPCDAMLVVETVVAGRVAEQAGLKPGDVLLSSTVIGGLEEGEHADPSPLASPYDVWRLEAAWGRVRFEGLRDDEPLVVELRGGLWGIRTRPMLDHPTDRIYGETLALIESGAVDEGVEELQRLALDARRSDKTELACWLLEQAGTRLAKASKWKASEQLFLQAASMAAGAGRAGLEAYIRYNQGRALRSRRRFDEATAMFERAGEMWQAAGSAEAEMAMALETHGRLARARGQLDIAETILTRSLAIRQSLSAESLNTAESFRALGQVSLRRGEFREAERLIGKALAIQEKKAPKGLEIVDSLNYLAFVAIREVAYEKAEARAERALSIVEKLAPKSRGMETALGNLGTLARATRNLVEAEEYYRRALAVAEARHPGSGNVASLSTSLGIVLRDRGDLPAAETLYKRALAINEKLGPESPTVALVLNNLADLAIKRGELEEAEALLKRSLAIQDKVVPGTTFQAITLQNLGVVASRQGKIATAETLHKRAIEIVEAHTPGNPQTAESYYELGNLARSRDALQEARDLHLQALEIRRRYLRGRFEEAESLFALGQIALDRGDRREAVDWMVKAIDALEAQTERLGGRQEVRAEFAAAYLGYYHQLASTLLGLERPVDAFNIVERSRARALLNLLAERELDFDSAVPKEFLQERKDIERAYDRAQAQLATLNATSSPGEVDRLHEHQTELRNRLEFLKTTARRQSPRFAALEYPEPFDLGRARRALDPGTLLLSYLVTEKETFLFAVQPTEIPGLGLSVTRIDVGREALRREVSLFRSFIERSRRNEDVEPALQARSAALFALLLAPVADAIESAERILISSDGPLHTLPFSALARDTGNPVQPATEYLVEWKPLHRVISATVYGELSRSRREARSKWPIQIAAFADPTLPAEWLSDSSSIPVDALRGFLSGDRGIALGPLPESREEARAIAKLWGSEAQIFVGEKATEDQVAVIGRNARMLHFASHSVLDEEAPLNSSLVLALDDRASQGRENGLLQAWEIFEKLNIDADLVTLSACQTALGKEIGGDGLIGLARAFQYAGARSVLASLWSVSDRSTTELMTRFYTELKSGRTKDQSLREAQIQLIQGNRATRAPFHWAAFELIGDWR